MARTVRARDRRWLVLGVLGALPPVAEMLVLWATGLQSDRALVTQVTAPSPWAEYHDLRWLLVFHDSWLSLALEAMALIVLRSVLDALIVAASWPVTDGRSARPPWGSLIGRLAVSVPVIWLFLLPWAVLGFGMGVVSISWLFFTAVPPVLVNALVCSPAAADPGWWCRVPPRAAPGTAVVVFAGQSVASVLMISAPAVLWLPLAAAAGIGNAWLWSRLVRALAAAGAADRSRVPVGPIVAAGMVVVAVSGAATSFAVVGSRHPGAGGTTAAAATPRAGEAPVLVASGFDSKIDRSTPPVPLSVGSPVRYSYRGSDAQGRPEPYRPGDTHQGLAVLVRLMAEQVDALHAASGRQVSIVAESEGSLVAQVYLAADPRAPVARLVLLSPLDRPARVYYPPAGRSGYGLATGVALQSLTDALGGISPVHLPADSPFLRSIVGHAAALRDLLACPPAVPEDILEPLADSLADPAPPPAGIPAVVLPAFHGGLLTNPEAQRDIDRWLAGGRVSSDPVTDAAETLLRRAAAGWQVPALPLALYSASPDRPSCAATTGALRRWVGPVG